MFREPWIVMSKLENQEPNGLLKGMQQAHSALTWSSTMSVSFLIPLQITDTIHLQGAKPSFGLGEDFQLMTD